MEDLFASNAEQKEEVPDLFAPVEPPTILGEIPKGLKAGVQQLRGFGYGLGALAGETTGIEPIKSWAKEGLADVEAKTPKPAVGSFSDIENVSDVGKYLAYGVATNLPNMLLSLTGGGLGAIAAKGMVGSLAKKAIVDAAIKRGAVTGAFGASFGMEAGSIASDQLTETGKVDPLRAVAGAIPAAALDVIPEWYLAKRLGWLGKDVAKMEGGRITRALKIGGQQFAMEAPTEAMQSAIERASVPGKSISNGEAWDEYINSFILGGMTGGVVGGAGGVFAKKETPVQQSLKADPLESQRMDIINSDPDLKAMAEQIDIPVMPIVPAGVSGIPPVTPAAEPTPPILPITPAVPVAPETPYPSTPATPEQIDNRINPRDPTDIWTPEKRLQLVQEQNQAENPSPAAEGFAKNGYTTKVNAYQWIKLNGKNASDYNVLQENGRWMVTPKVSKQQIDTAAHEAATSPTNPLPEPSQAQKEAGNYKLGHTNIQGLDISIENPAGSVRKGVDENGKPWETPIAYHYGYIRKTEGKDGDHVDTFIGPNPESTKVFIVDQKDPKTGKFDEHKTLVGFNTQEEARQGYLANYDESGSSRIMGITEMPMTEFKEWLKGDTTKRVSKTTPSAPTAAEGIVPPEQSSQAVPGEQAAQPAAEAVPETPIQPLIAKPPWGMTWEESRTSKIGVNDYEDSIKSAIEEGKKISDGVVASLPMGLKARLFPELAGNAPWQRTASEFENEYLLHGTNLPKGEGISYVEPRIGEFTRQMYSGAGEGTFEEMGGKPLAYFSSPKDAKHIEQYAEGVAVYPKKGEPYILVTDKPSDLLMVEEDGLYDSEDNLVSRDTGIGPETGDIISEEGAAVLYKIPLAKWRQSGAKSIHEYFVKQALSEGKPVPPEVLADYPDLQPPAEPPGDAATRAKIAEGRAIPNKTMAADIRPEDTWGGYAEELDDTVRQAWKTKLEGYNERTRTVRENRDKTTNSNSPYGGNDEVSLRRRLRDGRLLDAQVKSSTSFGDGTRWTDVAVSPEFASTPEFRLAEQHFARLGYQTVPVSSVTWGGAVNTGTNIVFLGRMAGDRFAYFMAHETSHILSAQGNESIKAIKESVNLGHPFVKTTQKSYGWSDDYTRDEYAAAFVGGMTDVSGILTGDQTENLRVARGNVANPTPGKTTAPTGPSYGTISPERKPFFSKLSQVVQNASFTKMPVPQLKAFLKGKQVTDAEIENITGALTGTVTKQQVMDEIKVNGTEFQDVVLGQRDRHPSLIYADEAANKYGTDTDKWPEDVWTEYERLSKEPRPADALPTHFSQYVEPGAVPGSYREMFVTVPDVGLGGNQEMWIDANGKEVPMALELPERDYETEKRKFIHRGEKVEFRKTAPWQDGHSQYSSITNPIVRIRYNEREADGKRILFVEEIQGPNDANQQKMPEHLRKRIYDIGVKRVLALAKEGGYDAVAWTPGEMQASRYDLSKQISWIEWDPETNEFSAESKNGNEIIRRPVPANELPDVIGKELAARLTTDGQYQEQGRFRTLSGLDLKVGGEGLKSLYDRTLPAMFKKYGKEGVGEIKIDQGNDLTAKLEYSGPILRIDGVREKIKSLNNATLERQAREVAMEMVNGETFGDAMSHQSTALAEAFGGKLSELPRKTATVPMIPITPNTPSSFTMYGDVAPISTNLKRVIGTLTSTFTDNPQHFPESLNTTLKQNFQGLKAGELSGLDYAFSLPFHMSQKYPKEWGPMWNIHGIERPEMRSDLRSEHVKYAKDYFELDNQLKKDGLTRVQRKEAKARVVRMVFATDAMLPLELADLIKQAHAAPTNAEAQALQKKIDDIRTLRRYPDAKLRSGIVDEYGDTIKLNSDTEIKAYTAERHALDKVMDAKVDWLHTMAFMKWKDQKWYKLLLQASGMDLTKENVQTLLNEKGLNAAALASAKKIQVDLDSAFASVDQAIDKAPTDELVAVAERYDKLYTRVAENLLQFQKYLGQVTGITDKAELSKVTREVFAAYVQTRPYLKQIKQLRNQMGNLPGYAPRTREQGKYKIKLLKMGVDELTGLPKVEREISSEMFNTEREYRELYADLLAKHADKDGNLPENYKIDAEKATVSPEMAFQGVSDVNTQRIIDDALKNMKQKGPLSDAIYDQLQQDAYQAIANQFMTRGAGKAQIHRAPGEAIKGYDEQNLDQVLIGYISSMTGIMTKQLAAAKALDHLKGIEDPKHFAALSKYNREMLRNDSQGDKLSGIARSVAFVWFLGGLMKSAAVNLTQNPIVGFAELQKYMKTNGLKGIGDVEYAKALNDVLFSKLSTQEKTFVSEMISKGIAQDQYIQSIFEGMHGKLEQTFLMAARVLAIPFSKSEVYNRTSAGIALFRQAYPMYIKQGLSETEAYQKSFADARTFIDNVHYAYGKANRPLWMQSGDFSSKMLHTAYTFRGFTHNFLVRQATLLSQGDWQTFLHTMAYVAVLGGLMGLPFFKDFFDWTEKEFGFSPANYVRRTLRGIGGNTLETFGINGLPAVLGANISGSLAIGLPYPIGSRTPEDTIFGVWAGVAQKGQRAIEAAGRGNYSRALQEIAPEGLRAPTVALRESSLGKEVGYPGFATTPRGQAMMDETGKPISIKGHEVALKAIGFNPTSYAREKEKIATTTRQEAWVADQKTHLTETFRVARLRKDPDAMKDMMNAVRELNAKIRSRGLERLVPLASVQRVIQSARQTKGIKERREMRYKRAEL